MWKSFASANKHCGCERDHPVATGLIFDPTMATSIHSLLSLVSKCYTLTEDKIIDIERFTAMFHTIDFTWMMIAKNLSKIELHTFFKRENTINLSCQKELITEPLKQNMHVGTDIKKYFKVLVIVNAHK